MPTLMIVGVYTPLFEMRPLILFPAPALSTDQETGRLAVNCWFCKTEIVGGLAGETVSTGTTCRVVAPVTFCPVIAEVAEIFVFPVPASVAMLLVMVATPDADDPHPAEPVRFCVEPSEKIPVAVKLTGGEFTTTAGFPGATVIELSTMTCRPVEPVTPRAVAEMSVVPGLTSVAELLAIVATEGAEDDHVAVAVRSCVLLSE